MLKTTLKASFENKKQELFKQDIRLICLKFSFFLKNMLFYIKKRLTKILEVFK